MFVLHVIGDGRIGGGATVVLSLSRSLARSGVEVAIASESNSYLLQAAEESGISTLGLDFSSRRRSGLLALTLARYLRRAQPLVIHTHGSRAGLPVGLIPSILRSKSPIVHTVHGFHFVDKRGPSRMLARQAEMFCMHRSSRTVFVSNSDKRIAELERLSFYPFEVIHNGSHPAEPASAPFDFDIAYFARKIPQKNPLILLDVLVAMRPSRPTVYFIGDGELEETVRQRAQDLGLSSQIVFCASLPHELAMTQLIRARVMILPSLWEGLPMSVIEAMHRGMPVVASNVTGTNELVVDGETGFLVGVHNVAEYADRCQRLLGDESLRHQMGMAALKRAREHFSVDKQIESYLTLYSRVLGQ
jgi:glycosyltransferase involved in cell wall biosynthesis